MRQLLLFAALFLAVVTASSSTYVEYTDPASGVTYKYRPGSGVARVKDGYIPEEEGAMEVFSGNPHVKGDIVVLDRFNVDGQEYVVNRVEYCAFAHSAITSVTIPSTVTTIDEYAFYGCGSLASVTFSDGLQTLGSHVFEGCGALRSVVLPEGLKEMGSGIFSSCVSLESVSIPSTVEYIRWGNLFPGCPSLVSVTVAHSNARYDSRDGCNAIIDSEYDEVVAGCANTVIPPTVNIGSGAFAGCVFPDGEFLFPESLTSIGSYAFYGSNLRTITIPEGVTSIGNQAFCNIESLESIVLLAQTPPRRQILGGTGICENLSATLYVPAGTKEKYIADGWEKEFGAIVEMGAVGISGVTKGPESHGTAYDLQGRVAGSPHIGVVIRNGRKHGSWGQTR